MEKEERKKKNSSNRKLIYEKPSRTFLQRQPLNSTPRRHGPVPSPRPRCFSFHCHSVSPHFLLHFLCPCLLVIATGTLSTLSCCRSPGPRYCVPRPIWMSLSFGARVVPSWIYLVLGRQLVPNKCWLMNEIWVWRKPLEAQNILCHTISRTRLGRGLGCRQEAARAGGACAEVPGINRRWWRTLRSPIR